ncbi:hypothetical protein [Borreliella turdi]|nr:hypothetical protein [Borreliella turdi]
MTSKDLIIVLLLSKEFKIKENALNNSFFNSNFNSKLDLVVFFTYVFS